MIKRFVPAALAAAAFALPASAATTLTITPNPDPCTGDTCSFTIGGITTETEFTAEASFVIPSLGDLATTVTSIAVKLNGPTDAKFTSVFLTTPSMTTVTVPINLTGKKEEATLDSLIVAAGTYKLTVKGTLPVGGNAAFGGNLSFAAVPEASTWAFMILGFGIVGGALRRSKARPALRYA